MRSKKTLMMRQKRAECLEKPNCPRPQSMEWTKPVHVRTPHDPELLWAIYDAQMQAVNDELDHILVAEELEFQYGVI